MALCHKWDSKNDFAYVLQFFSLISNGLGSVRNGSSIYRGAVADLLSKRQNHEEDFFQKKTS